jgi:hypothetical protein
MNDLNPDHVLFLTDWAARMGAVVDFAGTCGIGRECVGVLIGHSYLDYSHLWETDHDEDAWWAPEDAYHKHDCMAVLGRGPAAVAQLFEWAKWLDEHGWTVESEARRPDSMIDAMFHGFSTPKLMPPVAAPKNGDA